MKTNIYNYIQTNQKEPLTFEAIYSHFSQVDNTLTKQVLGALLKDLGKDGIIAEINKTFLDLNQLKDAEGYVHWGLNQLCWIEPIDSTNDYGIAFNPNDNLTHVFNKRKAQYGSFVKGKIIEGLDKSSFYITEVIKAKPIKIFAAYRESFQSWYILNSSSGFTFQSATISNNPKNFIEGDIAIFEKTNDQIIFVEKFGHVSEKGIESKLIQSLAHIYQSNNSEIITPKKILPFLDKKFFSIDGLNTRDIDDVICIEKHSKGYELWVGIADVASFVKPNDPQDIHAQDKCTSFYFLNNTIHMLSRDLAENYCSLTPGSAKLAMVCHISCDLEGNALSYEISNQEIKSHARLTYQDVDRVLEGSDPIESIINKDGYTKKWESISEPGTQWLYQNLQIFEEFSSKISKDYDPDYWILPSVDLVVGDNGKVDHLYVDQRNNTKSQKIVETAMLAANKMAAKFLSEKYPHIGLFRNQTAPLQEFEKPKPAFYHADNIGHWGLQTDFYTHFTSPIRRFCDLVAHRLIKNVLQSNSTNIYTKEEIDSFVNKINFQQYVARQATNREKNLLMSQYLQELIEDKKLQVKFKIVDINKNGIVVRNNQLIENYIPQFKIDKGFYSELSKIDIETITPKNKEALINQLNENWKIKCFIDNHHWLDERKEVTYKFYVRDLKDTESEKLNHVKI